MKTSINNAIPLFLTAVLSAGACQTPKLALQGSDWQGQEVLDVKGRQGLRIKQQLAFGQYSTQRVDRSWTKESSWRIGTARRTLQVPEATNIISYEHINRQQTIRFASVSPSGEVADVYAATKVKARELIVGEGNGLGSFTLDLVNLFDNKSNNYYYVQIYLDGESKPWQLVLDNEHSQLKPAKYTGYLYGPNGRYYQLKPVRHLSGKNGEPKKMIMGAAGFEIKDENGVSLAAVSVIDNGQVYISKTIRPSERFLLENLCAALLLQDQI